MHLILTDTDNIIPVSSYIPGKLYALRINATNNSAALPKYGFQLSSVKNSNIVGQAGDLYTAGNPDVAIKLSEGIQIIEHSHPITASGSGTTWNYITHCHWVAPPAGTGQVKFFLTLNAVNANGFASGDQPNITSLVVDDGAASVSEQNLLNHFNTYPNPVTNKLSIEATNIENGIYYFNVYDITGKHTASQSVTVTDNALHLSLDASSWQPGVVFVHAQKGNEQKIFFITRK